LRKLVAAFLSVWLLFMSGGYATAFAAELQHDLQCVQAGMDAPVPSNSDGACPHGCAAHLAGHLFTVADYGGDTVESSPNADWLAALYTGGFYSITSSLFLPPKVLLA
jgi:hypothetical protein